MVVGDVVSGINPVISANFTFQPAASVECLISSAGAVGSWIYLNDGVNNGHVTISNSSNTGTSAQMKLFINNTNYLIVVGSGGYYNNYTGVQIK